MSTPSAVVAKGRRPCSTRSLIPSSAHCQRLCDGGLPTSQVTKVIPVSRQAATKHLLLLEAVGLVSSERQGRERIWRIEPEPLTDASDYLAALSKRWDKAIDRLRAYVEDE